MGSSKMAWLEVIERFHEMLQGQINPGVFQRNRLLRLDPNGSKILTLILHRVSLVQVRGARGAAV